MKRIIFKTMAMSTLCLVAAVFASCDDGADTDSSSTLLQLSKKKVEVSVGQTDTLTVGNGTQPFIAKSSATTIATVSVKKDSIFVKGVKSGTANMVVTDNKKATASVSVSVK